RHTCIFILHVFPVSLVRIARASAGRPHHHCRPECRRAPAQIGGVAHVAHLAAAALAVVVGVGGLAAGAARAGVVGVAGELAHVPDPHVAAVGVPLAEVTAAGVIGTAAAEPHGA